MTIDEKAAKRKLCWILHRLRPSKPEAPRREICPGCVWACQTGRRATCPRIECEKAREF